MQVSDDLYLGGFSIGSGGPPPAATSAENPTINQGVGPMGRVAHRSIVPLTKQNNNLATTQHITNGTPLTLTAGTGVTSTTAPDGSGSTVLKFDVARCPSLTSTANLSAANFTFVGFDEYGRKTTQTMAGPNNNTVIAKKAFMSILSVTPDTTDGANNVTAGSSDTFGLQYAISDATFLTAVKWANSFVTDTGTFTVADATTPATASTGDPRGTYVPSSASNGSRRLIIQMHLGPTQCGASSTQVGAIGVVPA